MDMRGKTVLITGSTDGVGRYVAGRLAGEGAKVLIHGRDAARAKALSGEIVEAGHVAPVFYQADLSSMGHARACRSGEAGSSAPRRARQQCRHRLAERRGRAASER